MDRTAYSRELRRLDTFQKKAVLTTEGPVMVIAGPGTGKTQILSLRIATILKKMQCGPENILALTFTEIGAEEMRLRLHKLIGKESYRVHVHTFHGFCNSIIQSYPHFFEERISSIPATDVDIVGVIRSGIDLPDIQLLRPSGDRYFYVSHLTKLFSDLKKESIQPSEYARAVEHWMKDFELRDDLRHAAGKFKGEMKGEYAVQDKQIKRAQEAAHLYAYYEKSMKKMGLYDFNDMVNEVVQKLHNNEQLKQQLQEHYQYILVDEHQDTNYGQNKLIELLCDYDDYPNLFVVGDEKQSIFRFQGASLENLIYFKQRFPRALLIQLEKSYRSTQMLLNAANGMVSHASQLLIKNPHLISAVGKGRGKIPIHVYETESDERHAVVEEIKKLLRSGVSASEIALIVRTNAEVETLSRLLRHYAITHHAEVFLSVMDDRQIGRLITLLRSIDNPLDDSALSRTLLMKELKLPVIDVCRILSYASRKKVPLIQCIGLKAHLIEARVQSSRSLLQFSKQLEKWKVLAENTSCDRFFIELVDDIKFLSQMGKTGKFLETMDLLTSVYEEIQQLMRRDHSLSLHTYLEHVDLISEYRIRNKHKAPLIYRDGVRIMTAHKSKGTEYDHVFITGLSEGRWGAGRERQSPLLIPWKYLARLPFVESEDLEKDDQRRLFYVAMTRAKKMVHLSIYQRDSDGKTDVPASLISEIPHEYVAEVSGGPSGKEHTVWQKKNRLMLFRSKGEEAELAGYLVHRYRQNGLSVSALNNYLECPWKYFFRNLIRLPDTKTMSAVFGSSVHYAIQQSITQILNRKPVDLSLFLDYFDQHVEIQSVSSDELLQLKEKARNTLALFVAQRVQQWDTKREAERVISDIVIDENTRLNGKIDMIEFVNTNSRVVYDFKTGKPKSRNDILGNTKNSDGSYYRQLVFYALLLDQYKNGLLRVEEGVIEYVVPTGRNVIRSERFHIPHDDVRALIDQIRSVSSDIISLGFMKRGGCGKSTCEHCTLAETLNMTGNRSGR